MLDVGQKSGTGAVQGPPDLIWFDMIWVDFLILFLFDDFDRARAAELNRFNLI